jgi:hypothetical protein
LIFRSNSVCNVYNLLQKVFLSNFQSRPKHYANLSGHEKHYYGLRIRRGYLSYTCLDS